MNSKISLIISLSLTTFIFPQEDLKILSSNKSSIVFEYSPIYSIFPVEINNEIFQKILLKFGSAPNPDEFGVPSIPVRQIPVGVPSEFGNTLEILSTSVKELEGRIIPIPKLIKDNGIASEKFEMSEQYFSFDSQQNQIITFGEFAKIRGMPVQYFIIKPVSFSAAANKIQIFTKIVFRINYSSSQNVTAIEKDKFLSGIIPNYEVAKNWIKFKEKNKLNKSMASNSVLATGKWVRFETQEEGIYKISRSTFSSFGFDPGGVDPRTIKIYNNGGKVLPENVSADKPDDLVENSILVIGESDGQFDTDDYILFYGRGNNFWDYDPASRTIKRFFHPYSNVNYYWITYGGASGKRIQEKTSLNESNFFNQPYTLAFANLEEEKINIGKTGRVYLGDEFSQTANSRTYINKLDGRIDNSPMTYNFRFVNASSEAITLAVDENGSQIFGQTLGGYGNSDYSAGLAHSRSMVYNSSLPESRSVLKFRFTPGTSTSIGYLDYFEIKYNKNLNTVDDNLVFYSKDTSSIIEYDLYGFSSTNIRVFDVSDYVNVKLISNPIMQSGSEFRFQSAEAEGNVSKYFAVGSDNFKTPVNPTEISNQNLHGFSDGAKLIIITNKSLRDQAQRLKDHRENNSKLRVSTIITDINEIFNEFSGGLLDVSAIRNYIKYVYENWIIKPEYVLLFGDGTYDYKNLEKAGDNIIPAYETIESLNELYSYPMDDYFVRVDGNDSGLDLGIGRLNVSTLSEAQSVVDKIIEYESSHEFGIWRNLITLVADDNVTTQGLEGNYHTPQSETLANSIIPESFDINKIYLAAYPTVLTSLGRAKPGVYDEIINSINRGTLLLNYVGHGSPELWAHERVFVKSSTVPLLKNDKYFFLTAATCDFGLYDVPGTQSSTELLNVKEASGSIGVFTSTRPVYSFENARLNEALYSSLFLSPRDSLNLPIEVGKAYMKAKIIGSGNIANDEKFHLFCDPSLRLNIPQYIAEIDSINGQNLSFNVQIKALSNTKIDGVVKKSNDTEWNDFNGEGTLTVFDSERRVKLDPLGTPSNPYYVTVQGGIIFRGRISITNGEFSTKFTVPKDISYENKNGKVLIYFLSQNEDGLGYTSKVIIGGTDSNVVNDNKGPDIEVYFDEASVENTNLINPNSVLNVKLTDETGINTTGTGVGHKLEGILNEKFNEPIDFSNYFTGDLDAGGKSGSIRYQFNNLETGKYQMLLKAWDVFNNPSSETIYFDVVPGDDLFISDVFNYPNPFAANTTFTFQKNSINSPVDVDIKVYTIAGRLIRSIKVVGLNDNFVKIDWDGRDQDGNFIANGAYLYKLIVQSTDGNYKKSVLGKLAVIR